MNPHLTEAIVEHVFESFAIIPSDFINPYKSRPLINNEYQLPIKINFEIDGQMMQHSVWGCQLSVGGHDFKVLLGDCSDTTHAFAMVVTGKDLPTWALFLRLDNNDKETMIACSVPNDKNNSWMEATTFLQSSFLGAMEQLRESGLPWVKVSSYKEEFQQLLSFIKFHTTVYEGKDEGQKERF